MTTAIDALVDAAMAKAAAAAPSPAPSAGVPAPLTGEVLPPTSYTPAVLPSLKDVAASARTRVDHYLQVMKDGSGLKIGKTMGFPVDEFRGTINVPDIKNIFVIRVDNGGGQQAKYVKSVNMVTTTAGVPLDRAIKQVLLPGGQVKDPYVSFMVPIKLSEDVADQKKGSTFVAKAGEFVMAETSFSASMDFGGFVAKLERLGLLGATIPVIVKSKVIRSAGGIDYGSVEFDIDMAAPEAAALLG